jgi:poly-gamma-glutamate capsule biosynthesis protein CapA/YwtB (metallophosphatase superfamily)
MMARTAAANYARATNPTIHSANITSANAQYTQSSAMARAATVPGVGTRPGVVGTGTPTMNRPPTSGPGSRTYMING